MEERFFFTYVRCENIFSSARLRCIRKTLHSFNELYNVNYKCYDSISPRSSYSALTVACSLTAAYNSVEIKGLLGDKC